MSKFCAICTSERGPFTLGPYGKNNAWVDVCAGCNEPVFAREARGVGFVPNGGLPTYGQTLKGHRAALGDNYEREMARSRAVAMRHREIPPGWRIHRVRVSPGLDAQNAYKTLATQPWFGPGRVKYCGISGEWFVYGYAPRADLALPADSDPFESIRKYQVRS